MGAGDERSDCWLGGGCVTTGCAGTGFAAVTTGAGAGAGAITTGAAGGRTPGAGTGCRAAGGGWTAGGAGTCRCGAAVADAATDIAGISAAARAGPHPLVPTAANVTVDSTYAVVAARVDRLPMGPLPRTCQTLSGRTGRLGPPRASRPDRRSHDRSTSADLPPRDARTHPLAPKTTRPCGRAGGERNDPRQKRSRVPRPSRARSARPGTGPHDRWCGTRVRATGRSARITSAPPRRCRRRQLFRAAGPPRGDKHRDDATPTATPTDARARTPRSRGRAGRHLRGGGPAAGHRSDTAGLRPDDGRDLGGGRIVRRAHRLDRLERHRHRHFHRVRGRRRHSGQRAGRGAGHRRHHPDRRRHPRAGSQRPGHRRRRGCGAAL